MNGQAWGFVMLAAALCATCLAWVLPVLKAQPMPTTGPRSVAVVIRTQGPWALGVALAAVLGYAAVGNWSALEWDEQAATEMAALGARSTKASDAEVAVMVDRLADELARKPTDAQSAPLWVMLGRAQAGLLRFEEAATSFAAAAELMKGTERSAVLADQADAMLAARQGNPAFMASVNAATLVTQALSADPRNLKALALAGTLAFEARRYADAARHWGQAVEVAEAGAAGPELAASLRTSLDEARARSGGATGVPVSAAPVAGSTQAPLAVRGQVRVSAALQGQLQPDDVVFIVARAANAPPGTPPLAAQRLRVADLPSRFVLDDATSLNPQRPLSQAPEVLVSARVSRSGQALPQSGDWSSAVQPVRPGLGMVNLEIAAVVP